MIIEDNIPIIGGKELKILRIFFVIGCIILFALCMSGCANKQRELTVDELISLGEKFLLDLDYQQALIQFNKVIEIEPMNVRGYTGAAEAYIGLNKLEEAVSILEQGFEATNDEAISSMLEFMAISGGENEEDYLQTDYVIDEPDLNETQINLTDRDPFTIKDILDAGYCLPGTSIYDVKEQFGITSEEIDEAFENYGSIGMTRSRNINFNIDEEGLIDRYSLDMLHGGDGSYIVPRNIAWKTSLRDTINQYMLTNEKVWEVVDPGNWGSLIEQNDGIYYINLYEMTLDDYSLHAGIVLDINITSKKPFAAVVFTQEEKSGDLTISTTMILDFSADGLYSASISQMTY